MNLFRVLILCLIPSVAWGWQDRYDSLVQSSLNRSQGQALSLSLKEELRADPLSGSELELWRLLWKGSSRDRASTALALIEKLYPDGDLSRWEEVKGFIYPSQTPRSLMAVDGFMVAIGALLDLDGGTFLAGEMLRSFGSSPRAKHLFIDTLPKDMEYVLSDLVVRAGLSGFWVPSELKGSLPLGAPVRDSISQSSAVAKGMQFMDGAGVPANNGPYCWDRLTGKVYQVVDRQNPLWIPGF